MIKSNKFFWIFYIIWAIINITMLALAFYDVFGEFNKTTLEFWPFTIGNASYYDFFELIVYLGIPLIIFFIYKFINNYETNNNKEV